MNEIRIKLPIYAKDLIKNVRENNYRYFCLYGGRGSGKSYTIAYTLLLESLQSECFIVCGREYQNSIEDSVYKLLLNLIKEAGLEEYFEHTKNEIISKNGSKFVFKGLSRNIDSKKSMAGVTHLWIEEGDTLSLNSWRIIKPTVRAENSKIFITFNPKNVNDVAYEAFVINPTKNAYVRKVNYCDNRFFPLVLEEERENDEATLEREVYSHIWLGECLKISDAQIFKGKFFMQDFETDNTFDMPIYGMDFGFSQDPTCAIEVYIREDILYIRREACKVGLELDDTFQYISERIPNIEKYTLRADSARPESISYLARHGLPLIEGVKKGKGSVEDGIAFIKSFKKIIVHPSCKETLKELDYYSYKTDLRSGDITTIIIDKYNHCIDAIRYALQPFMKSDTLDFSKYK